MILLLTACSSIDCPVNSIVETIWKVYDGKGQELKLADTLTVTTVRKDAQVITVLNGRDATVLNKLTEKSTFNLPISYSHPEDVFVFHFDNSNNNNLHVTDTVWITKNDYAHFESVDCNSIFFHTLTGIRYTNHYLDSIVIKNPSVTYDYETVHLHIYPKSSN
jgi:hypothetical protein